jgi:hypothetical protein
MADVYKPLGGEVTLNVASGNTISSSNSGGSLIRIINTGGPNLLHFQYANGVEYANMTISNSESVIIWKNNTDLLLGNSMMAVPVAYR